MAPTPAGDPQPPVAPDAAVSGPMAMDGLFNTLYQELRRLARAKLRRLGGGGLNTTALVHESYLRLVRGQAPQLNDERHFMAYAAHVMRSVVVDLAREQSAERRGGGQAPVTLDTALMAGLPAGDDQVLALHEALLELQAIEPRMAQVVEMRYFGGLSMDEVAQALGVAKRTVERDWEKARSFLYASLQG